MDAILQESGDDILLETGDSLLLEQGWPGRQISAINGISLSQ